MPVDTERPADRPAQPLDHRMLLTGWGRHPATSCKVRKAHDPADPMLLAATTRGVIPRGLGRSYGDAAQNAGGVVVDMTGMSGVRHFDSVTGEITALAGTSIDELLRLIIPRGWFLPVTPGTRYVTVGGAIAADVHGKNHPTAGSLGRYVTRLELITPTGERITTSRSEVPDLFHATVGGMGLTGVITEATIRLVAIETSWMQVDNERVDDLDDLMGLMINGDRDHPHAVAWIDLMASGKELGRSILTTGRHAELAALPRRLRHRPLRSPPRRKVSIPPWTPGTLLNRLAVTAFNEATFRRAPVSSRDRLESLGSFFYPLDAIGEWNRLYGRRGFLQYQIAVPDRGAEAIRSVVELLAAADCPVFLAVLKRLGDEEGLLSFPIAGWTLAVDIPLGVAGLAEVLTASDEIVAERGGRVYLAKDSRLRPEVFREMYPRYTEWRTIRDHVDPNGTMRSDLARRLELVD